MRLKVRVRYEGQDMAFDMPVGDGRMTIKWLGERAHVSGARPRNQPPPKLTYPSFFLIHVLVPQSIGLTNMQVIESCRHTTILSEKCGIPE